MVLCCSGCITTEDGLQDLDCLRDCVLEMPSGMSVLTRLTHLRPLHGYGTAHLDLSCANGLSLLCPLEVTACVGCLVATELGMLARLTQMHVLHTGFANERWELSFI